MAIHPSFRRYLATRWGWDRQRAATFGLLAACFVLVNTQRGWRDPLFVLLVCVAIAAIGLVVVGVGLVIYFGRAALSTEGQSIRFVGLTRTLNYPLNEILQLNRAVMVALWSAPQRFFMALDSKNTVMFYLSDELWDPGAVETFAHMNGIPITGDWTRVVPLASIKVGSRLT